MIALELEKRDRVRRDAPRIIEVLESTDQPEEEYTCGICKAFCYLSQVVCQCSPRVACPDHASQLCKCSPSLRTLRKRYSESQLVDIQRAVSDRAGVPTSWQTKFENILAETARPHIKALRNLVTEGEKILYPIPELGNLRSFVNQINSWVSRATAILSKKKGVRKRKVRDEEGDTPMDDGDDADRKITAETLSDLLTSADKLAFEAPEIAQIRQLVHSVWDFQAKAQELCAEDESVTPTRRYRQLLYQGEGLNVDIPELTQLDRIVKRKEWLKAMNEVDEAFLKIEDVQRHLTQAGELGIPDSHPFVVELTAKAEKGKAWRVVAKELLSRSTKWDPATPRLITIAELEEIAKDDPEVPNMGHTHTQILDLLKRTQAVANSCQYSLTIQGPEAKSIVYARKLIKAAETRASGMIIPELQALEEMVKRYDAWIDQAGKLLGVEDDPPAALGSMMQKVKLLLNPRDDAYPSEFNAILTGTGRKETNSAAVSQFNCLCRLPPSRTMLQCRKCLELYHTSCLDPAYIEAPDSLIIKCPFCRSKDAQGQKPPPRPSLLKFAPLLDERIYDLTFKFEEVYQIQELIEICARVARIVLPKISPNEDQLLTEDQRFLRHWVRKLRDLPVNIEVHPDTGASISLYPSVLGRLKHLRKMAPAYPAGIDGGRPATPPGLVREAIAEARKRFHWPYFRFEQIQKNDGDVQCICEKAPPQNYIKVHCRMCRQGYHAACVLAPTACLGSSPRPWLCPPCSINDGLRYETAEVRCLYRGTRIYLEILWSLG